MEFHSNSDKLRKIKELLKNFIFFFSKMYPNFDEQRKIADLPKNIEFFFFNVNVKYLCQIQQTLQSKILQSSQIKFLSKCYSTPTLLNFNTNLFKRTPFHKSFFFFFLILFRNSDSLCSLLSLLQAVLFHPCGREN